MDRRGFVASAGLGLAAILAGCSTSGEFDPDVEPVERLGAAPRVSMTVSAERDFRATDERPFEEWATRRAAEHAIARLRSILTAASLTGVGVSIGGGAVHFDELDFPDGADPPEESEFHRADPIGPRVFHYRHYARDGELISKPAVEFGAIVEATPRSFEVRMAYPDETYVAVLPALCERGWIRND